MLKAAVIFFIMGLFSFVLGAKGLAGVTAQIGNNLLILFLIFSLLSFIGAITTGKIKDRM